MENKHKISKKKQTASSLQRIEHSRQLGRITNYNKISNNISNNEISSYSKNNEFSTSIYESENVDMCLGK